MAKLATIFRRTDAPARLGSVRNEPRLRIAVDPHKLRALPNDDVYFFSKRIDNSRIVREADPGGRGECWSTIGVGCAVAAFAGLLMAPAVAGVFAGYKLESLKQERQGLLDERRVLAAEESALLTTAHLTEVAGRRTLHLERPKPGQIIRLNPANTGAVALNFDRR